MQVHMVQAQVHEAKDQLDAHSFITVDQTGDDEEQEEQLDPTPSTTIWANHMGKWLLEARDQQDLNLFSSISSLPSNGGC